MSNLIFCGATRTFTQAAASGTPLPWGPEILKRDSAAQVTQLQTRYGMTGTVQTQDRGGARGAQPPHNCQLISMPLFIAGCKDQNGSEMAAQEHFRGMQPP
jgi:hypothetical protein